MYLQIALCFLLLATASGQDTPLMALYPGVWAIEYYLAAWAAIPSLQNSYFPNPQYGFRLDSNPHTLLIGGGPLTTQRTIMFYRFDSGTGLYTNPLAMRAWIYRDPKISSDTSSYISETGHNVVNLQRFTNNALTSSLLGTSKDFTRKGTTQCVDGDFPCDVLALSYDGKYTAFGEPFQSKTNNGFVQNGFVTIVYCWDTNSCGNRNLLYRNAINSNAEERLLWGRDPGSRYGSSVTVGKRLGSTTITLVVAGAPGDVRQQDGAEYPDYDLGGNNGDYRYGGYFQTMVELSDRINTRIIDRVWAPDGNTPAAAGNKFGSIVRLTPDGSKLLVTAPGTTVGGQVRGAFYIYENVQAGFDGADSFQYFKGPYYGPGADQRFGWAATISPDGNEVFIGAPDYNDGDGCVYRFTYVPSIGEYALQSTYIDSESGVGGGLGTSITFDYTRQKLYLGAPNGVEYLASNDQQYTNLGKVNIYTVAPPTPQPTKSPTPDPGNPTRRPTRFPTTSPTTPHPTGAPTTAPTTTPVCDTTADCAAWPDRICDKTVMGCVKVPCGDHSTCFEHTLVGRLPFCDPKRRHCVDTRSSTCTRPATCLSAATTQTSQTNAISTSKLAVRETDPVKRASAVQQTIDAVSNISPTSSLTVSAEESMSMPVLTNLTIEEVLDAVKTQRCGDLAELCTISVPSRRMLDEGDITVTISYNLDQTLYAELIANGTNFNDPSFAASVASSLGVNSSDVVITDNGGVLEVQITLVDVSEEGTPIEDDAIGEFLAITNQLSNITSQIASDLGIDESSFDEPVVDLCGAERNCNGRGTCDSGTGVCTCNSIAYFGLNCEQITAAPTKSPSVSPTHRPTSSPTVRPTPFPTKEVTLPPTPHPTGAFPADTVGFTSVTLNIVNYTSLETAALQLKDEIKTANATANSTRFKFTGTQRFIIPLEVYNVDPDEGFKRGAMEGIRGCPPLVCTTTFTTNSRRMLQSSGVVIVEMTYTLSEQAFQNFIASGFDFASDEFARRLETEFGLPEGVVTVSTISNSIVVEVEVVSIPIDALPTSSNSFSALYETKTLLDTKADEVIALFGVSGDTVTKTSINLCSGRETCSGQGTCNGATGVCECNTGWLGINCQTPCICQNGGNCATGSCSCLFPYFGVLCEQTNTECTTCYI